MPTERTLQEPIGLGCVSRGIADRIARYGVESRERLGRLRWVVERTLGWLHHFRRLRIRHERRADMRQALLSLAYWLICWRYVERFCSMLLFQASIESYLISVQSMWERGLCKLLISREKSLLGKDGGSALQRATWSSGTKSLQFHFERLIGFPITAVGTYEDLDLLQNLGNAIRHGDGPSAERVHKLAPSLWWNWIAPNETLQAGPFTVEASDSVSKHPSFDIISLGKSVLEQMMQAVCEFWQDLEYMRCNSFRNKHESTLRQMSAWAEERRGRRKKRVWTAG